MSGVSCKILPGREIAIKYNEVDMRLFVDMNVGMLCTYSNTMTNKCIVFCFNIKVGHTIHLNFILLL